MFTRQPSTGWVIFHEVVETTKSFMRDLTVVEEEWLVELAYVKTLYFPSSQTLIRQTTLLHFHRRWTEEALICIFIPGSERSTILHPILAILSFLP